MQSPQQQMAKFIKCVISFKFNLSKAKKCPLNICMPPKNSIRPSKQKNSNWR